MRSLRQEVPEQDEHLVTETAKHPKSVKIYTQLKFPNDHITFHAQPSFGGKPWFDYGWLRVDEDQEGAEQDPFYPDQYRMLVKFWAFPEVNGKIYAVVTYHERVAYKGPARWNGHPLLRTYKHLVIKQGGSHVLPLYSITPESIIGSAVVFPDPDNAGYILYMPNDLEICNGSAAELPDVDDYLPPPPDDSSSSEDMEESEGEGDEVESEEEGEGEDDEEGEEDDEEEEYYEDEEDEEGEEEEEEDEGAEYDD
jgi:hypothetical protein